MDEEKMIARISALMAKTEEAGATEDEALLAAEKARELIDKYQIDIKKVAEYALASGTRIGVEKREFRPALRKTRLHEVKRIFGVLGDYCDVIILTVTSRYQADRIAVVGEPIDCKLAFFMISNLRASLDMACEMAVRERGIMNTSSARRSFMTGATHSLSVRLYKMARARSEKHKTNGCDLVVVKESAIRAECDRLFPEAKTGRPRKPKVDIEFMVGQEAGKKIPIQQGVDGGQYAREILGVETTNKEKDYA